MINAFVKDDICICYEIVDFNEFSLKYTGYVNAGAIIEEKRHYIDDEIKAYCYYLDLKKMDLNINNDLINKVKLLDYFDFSKDEYFNLVTDYEWEK